MHKSAIVRLLSVQRLVMLLAIVSVAGIAAADGETDAPKKSDVGISHLPAPDATATPYDLVLDENGNVRPQYQQIFPIWKTMDKARYDRRSRKDFRGFYSVDSLPLLMPREQFDLKQKGEVQRAKAIHKFLVDYYSGKKSYAKANVIPESVVQRIIKRNGEAGFEKFVTPEMLSYPSGTDVTFNNRGEPIAIEDNVGYVGGTGDMHRMIKSLLKNQPQYKNILKLPDPMKHYKDLIASYRAHAVPKDGIIVLYQVPPYDDAEEVLMAEVFPQNGVRVITPKTKSHFVVNSKGVFVKNKKGKLERVGYVIVNSDISDNDVDPLFPGLVEKFYLDEIQEHLDSPLSPRARSELSKLPQMRDPLTGQLDLKRINRIINLHSDYINDIPETLTHSVPGLFKAAHDGKVGMSYSPGVDFVGDKEFYTYVEDLIRFYMKEEPIIKNIPTRRFGKVDADGHVRLDVDLLNETLANYRNFVFKVVDGRGGNGVWIGPKMTAVDLAEVRLQVEKDPGRYIVQDYVQLARKNGTLIDTRSVLHMFADGTVFIPGFSWGRSVSADGDGKVNMSQHGRVSPTFPVDGPSCGSEFSSGHMR